jgi:PhnB protein
MQVQPYLFFDGRCEEALEFYKKAIDAKVEMLMRFKDAPDQSMISPGSHDKVMHAAVRVGDTQVLVSDGRCLGKPSFQGFALTITAPDAAEGERRFNALADGGQVQMPLAETFFASRFGMVADKFGLGWMILVEKK